MMGKKSFKRAALASLAFACLPCGVSQAQLAGDQTRTVADQVAALSRPCVLLRNDNVMFGEAQQIGQFVVIRSGDSGEIQLPRQDVACWAPSIHDLYRYRVDHRHRADASTHLADARWCLDNELLDYAMVEIAAVRKIDPNNAEAASIEARLQRSRSPKPRSVPVVNQAIVEQVAHQDSGPDLADIDLETLRFFGVHLQPMLLNRCGNCHGHDSGRPWTLIVPSPGSRASSRITQENLSSSLSFIDRANPPNSELLQKSVSPHGGSSAPLDPRHSKSIDALKFWLASLQRDAQPMFGSSDAGSTQPAGTPYIAERPLQNHVGSAETMPTNVSPFNEFATEEFSGVEIVETPKTPARMPRVEDPFSPDLFNRRHHGGPSF